MTQHLPSRTGQDPAHLLPRSFGSPAVPAASGVQPWAPPRPAHRPPGPARFLVIVLLVVGLVVAGLQTLPVFDTAPPTPTASPTTTATDPATPSSRVEPGNPLTDSKLYPLRVTGSCPAVRSVTSRDAYEKQVSELLACLEGIFQPLIDRADGEFSRAKHRFYGTSTSSPCGSESDAYAFYCAENATLYFSDKVYDDARYARLVVADVVIHEYGHHVQFMMGVFDAAEELDESRATITRREELQVFCWTYYIFASLPSFSLTVDDHSFFRQTWDHTDDPDGHGSVKAQQYWGSRGLGGQNLGACNTWSAPKERVR